ncbi:hypothetical protein [Singulisphaera sp. PoT]|uniref:hypothetical protein n=1 Tax=Singulisphaera sp. PoT TaxID=3411797 RepID=UPI003BF4954A
MSKIVREDATSSQAPPRHVPREGFPDLSYQAALKAEAERQEDAKRPPAGPLFERRKGGEA